MNRYEPGTPRALFGLAAVALTAATLAIAVIAPAAVDYGTQEIGVLTRSIDVAPARAGDQATASIEVVAVRGTRIVPVVQSRAKNGLPG